jgi:RNA polymerase sigma-70 factor (ECF subfamily)
MSPCGEVMSQVPSPECTDPRGGASESVAEPQWTALVESIRMGDSAGLEDLYRVFSKGVRFFLCRQLGPQDLDDKVHDVFLIIAQAIQRGDLREPERLMGYVRTVVRRQVAGHIEHAVHSRRKEVDVDSGMPLADHGANPEQIALAREQADVAARILQSISKRDREILTRFYLNEQTQEQICREMRLTETQFRLIKSRAKARFGELGKQMLARRKAIRNG